MALDSFQNLRDIGNGLADGKDATGFKTCQQAVHLGAGQPRKARPVFCQKFPDHRIDGLAPILRHQRGRLRQGSGDIHHRFQLVEDAGKRLDIMVDAEEADRFAFCIAQHGSDGLQPAAIPVGFAVGADHVFVERRCQSSLVERAISRPPPRKGIGDMEDQAGLKVVQNRFHMR